MRKITWIQILLALIINSCNEVEIIDPVQSFGITGKVIDTLGNPINNVNIYCLFVYDYIPYSSSMPKQILYTADIDSFEFNLYQNFPNPVYNSAFIRFSIPDDMDIEFTLKEKVFGSTQYSFSGFYYYGLYQHHLNEFVRKYQMENGCYLMRLKAGKNGNTRFDSQKKLFVVSDIGKPNANSNQEGFYFFDYKKACIGDTIFSTFDGTYTYPIEITNQINLLFRKDGFIPVIQNISLYPELLLTRDIVLLKENSK